MQEKLLKKNELAERLGLCISTIDNYMAEGMPHVKLHASKTGRVRFEYDKVMEWIRGRGGARTE